MISKEVQSSISLHVSFQDPVCGSAHCALTPYWSKKLGKCDFKAYQVWTLTPFV